MHPKARKVGFSEPENYHRNCPGVPAEGPKVLIVEDHDDSRDMLRTLMKMWGCRVVEACNGVEAVECARRERPAVILMDGSLPLLDGVGATRRIREDAQLRDVLILGLNGWGTSAFNTAALAAGCNETLEKPLDFERLRRYLLPLFETPPVLERQGGPQEVLPLDLHAIELNPELDRGQNKLCTG